MTYYKFQTYRTSYYFPKMHKDSYFMYGLYNPFGGKLSKIYWWLFKHFSLIRVLNHVKSAKMFLPFQKIFELEGNQSLMSFNMGTPGDEQKISIFGFDKKLNQRFFAKFSQNLSAKALSINEIFVLETLKTTGLVPQLLFNYIADDFVFLKTEYLEGTSPRTIELTDDVYSLLIQLSRFHLLKDNNTSTDFIFCLSHGDFCPWNMILQKNVIKMIDWEMAKDRPLGYDLFTFIFQPAFLIKADLSVKKLLKKNLTIINKYFLQLKCTDFMPYLIYFSKEKMAEATVKKAGILLKKYTELYNLLNS
jgi:hypothetical protein